MNEEEGGGQGTSYIVQSCSDLSDRVLSDHSLNERGTGAAFFSQNDMVGSHTYIVPHVQLLKK